MAKTVSLDLDPQALDPGCDRGEALRRIAMLAASCEPQPAYWEERFLGAMDGALRLPQIEDVMAGRSIEDALADAFSLRPAATALDDDADGYPGAASSGRRLARLLIADKAVCVDLSCAAPSERRPGSDDAELDFIAIQEWLGDNLRRLGIEGRTPAYSMRCDHPDIERFIHINLDTVRTPSVLIVKLSDDFMEAVRDGALIELKDSRQPCRAIRESMRKTESAEAGWVYGRLRAQELWRELLMLWNESGVVRPVLENRSDVTSPLSAGERPDSVRPGLLQPVRAESAVLHLDFDVGGLGTLEAGVELRESVRTTLRLADNLFDQIHWPLEGIRRDARAHRRVALNLCGIGDAVERAGLDPDRFDTLRWIEKLLGEIKECARKYSTELARERGAYPGLRTDELFSLVPDVGLHDQVEAGIRCHATRHHQLITISPFSVLPRRSSARPARSYANLLPVLRLADSIGFAEVSGSPRLGIEDLEYFMRLSWAFTRRRHRGSNTANPPEAPQH